MNNKQLFDLEVLKQNNRSKAIGRAMPWLGRAGFVLCSWLPLQALGPMVDALAGKTTNVSLAISVSVVTSVGYVVENRRRAGKQKTIDKQAARLAVLEELGLAAIGIGKKEE